MADLEPTIKSQIQAEIDKLSYDAPEFKDMIISQKLTSVLGDLQNQEGVQQLWNDVSPAQKTEYLGKINIEFDTTTGQIEVKSNALNAEGAPMFDWKLNSEPVVVAPVAAAPIAVAPVVVAPVVVA